MDVSIYQLQYLEYWYWSFFKQCDLVLFTSQLSALGRRVVIGFDRVLSEYSLHCDSAVLVIDRSVKASLFGSQLLTTPTLYSTTARSYVGRRRSVQLYMIVQQHYMIVQCRVAGFSNIA